MKDCLNSKDGIRLFNKVSHEVLFCLNCNWLQSTRKDIAKHARGVSVFNTCHSIGVSSIAVHKHSLNPELLNFKAGVL